MVVHRERAPTQADQATQLATPLYTQLAALPSPTPALTQLVGASAKTDFLLRGSERRLRSFTANLTKSPQNELQLAFHLLEKDVQIHISKTAAVAEQTETRCDDVKTQQSQQRERRAAELAPHTAAAAKHRQDKLTLDKKRKDLLQQLAKVDAELASVERAAALTDKTTAATATRHAAAAANESKLLAGVTQQLQALHADKQCAESLHTLV